MLGVTPRTLYGPFNRGDLKAYRAGRLIRLKRGDVEAYVEACLIAPGTLRRLWDYGLNET